MLRKMHLYSNVLYVISKTTDLHTLVLWADWITRSRSELVKGPNKVCSLSLAVCVGGGGGDGGLGLVGWSVGLITLMLL